MIQAKLGGNLTGHGRRAITLRGMVAAGDEHHVHFARQMRLRLGNLAGDEGISTSGNCRLEIALGTATSPSYVFYRFFYRPRLHDRPA